ncbi:hypothetical protein LT85_2802 [Collimonas arenae]|uniref:Uncharacterized protein n=1 Tax=Collimonas arenae TaxID=279058 RepID=A0A0A1FDT6_9BURK|nr:hypothetical protein LT85_2802 [Collimonas arenae]
MAKDAQICQVDIHIENFTNKLTIYEMVLRISFNVRCRKEKY